MVPLVGVWHLFGKLEWSKNASHSRPLATRRFGGSDLIVFAQAAGGVNASANWFLIPGLFLIMYFVMIRPQQKQMKQQQALLAALKKGDEVVTQSGMFGRIYAITEKTITLEIANGVRVKVLKSSVQGKVSVSEIESTASAEKSKEAKS